MALIKCSECNTKISDKAINCTKCGAPMTEIAKSIKENEGKTSTLTKIITAFVVVIGIGMFIPHPTTPTPSSTPENQPKDSTSNRDEIALQATKLIKQKLKDPDSAKWSSIRANDDASIVCIEVRAKNGFGAYDLEQFSFIKGEAKTSLKVWNSNCVQPLNDVTSHVVRWLD